MKQKSIKDKITNMILRELKTWDGVECPGDLMFLADKYSPILANRIMRLIHNASLRKDRKA